MCRCILIVEVIMGTLYRAQILLETEQHKKLTELAKRDGRSISEIVREIVRAYLSEKDQDTRLARELRALEKLNEFRNKIKNKHGSLDNEFLEEARDERDQQLSFFWKDIR